MHVDVKVDALKFELDDGVAKRPIFIGALAVGQLSRLADVPSFDKDTSQSTIAGNVLRPPIKDWQRPLSERKVAAIKSRFERPHEFMPNPVLLAVSRPDLVSVTPKNVNGQATGIFTIEVHDDSGDERPLWVLDGQHRLRGLAESGRDENPIPFVLLHSESPGVYRPEDFAKIFAEVSTEATPLTDLHREWLQYAFRLGPYNPDAPGSEGAKAPSHQKSMEVVAILCDSQEFEAGTLVNPYFNKIQFNPKREPQPVHGSGFLFSAPALKDWVHKEYYSQPRPTDGFLEPGAVAKQLAKATLELTSSISTPVEDSAFFGAGSHRHQYLEQGFLCGVLSRLLMDPETDWSDLFGKLNFGTADWDLSWVKTTGGQAGNTSRKIARAVFCEAFTAGSLPYGTSDLVTYLRGDKAEVRLVASHYSEGRAQRGDKKPEGFRIEGVSAFDTGGREHVKLKPGSAHTANVGKLDVFDPEQPRGSDFTTPALRKGVVVSGRQELKIHGHTYGGRERELELTIRVS